MQAKVKEPGSVGLNHKQGVVIYFKLSKLRGLIIIKERKMSIRIEAYSDPVGGTRCRGHR